MEERQELENGRMIDAYEAVLKKSIATNLKRIMTSKGYSQTKLSEKSKIPQSTISDIMQEKFLANAGKIQLLADALNVPKSEIDPSFKPSEEFKYWGDKDNTNNSNQTYLQFLNHLYLEPIQLEIIFEMSEHILFEGKELDKEDKERILDMIRILLSKK